MWGVVLQEMASSTVVINLDRVDFWLKLITSAIAVISAVGGPIFYMLRRYSKGLKEATSAIKMQTTINEEQAACIKENRKSMGEIKTALKTLMRAQLSGQCADAMKAGEISMSDRMGILDMWGACQPLGVNHGMKSSIRAIERLPVRRD